jgi:hypothetical protein
MPASLEAHSVRRLAIACTSSLVLVVGLAATALGWVTPGLEGNCAPDENSFAWTISLHKEDNQNIEFSWNADFSDSWLVDIGTEGDHSFVTARGGETLYARYASDHNAATSADSFNGLCFDIDLDKTNDAGEEAVAPETLVTYFYEVTNNGELDLDVLAVTDIIAGSDEQPACTPLVRGADDPGDGDNVLEPEETWTYSCSVELTHTTTNHACVFANEHEEVTADLLLLVDDGPDAMACEDNTVTVGEGE